MSFLKKFLLYFNTIKFLRWEQVYFRLLRKIFRPSTKESQHEISIIKPKKWIHQSLHNCKIDKEKNAIFLNKKKKLNLPEDWNNSDLSKLWLYNLHYFEDLLSENSNDKYDLHLYLINNWIDNNHIGYGVGWEPYPSSLRIVNIFKYWLGGTDLNQKVFESLFKQSSYLANNLEKHLLGNHYFVNLKAMLFAGVIFDIKKWRNLAETNLIIEIDEQILDDGANFELSPMYHSLILVDFMDIYNLIEAYPGLVCKNLANKVMATIPKMFNFMQSMYHPDEEVSFFNDSVFEIAPSKKRITSYYEKLKFSNVKNDTHFIDNKNSGYYSSFFKRNKLIFDVSPIGPRYIPGHAHADTLSFELSLSKERVFVNSGTSEYISSEKRLNQRKTKAHNTVEINNKDSSKVWDSFRVANRANIIERHAKTKENQIIFSGAHDGYKSLFGGCIHRRELRLSKNSLIVSDVIEGNFKSAISRFFFHPNLKIYTNDNFLFCKGKNFIMKCNLNNLSASLSDSFWYPEFGKQIENKVLEVNFINKKLELEFIWSYF